MSDEYNNNYLEFDDNKSNLILNKILNNHLQYHKYSINISDDVYNDTQIDTWAEKLPILKGSSKLIKDIIRNPINDKTLLELRQKCSINYIDFSILKEYENDVLWTFSLNDEITDESSIHLLYITTYVLSYVNYCGPLLDFYHIYKIFFIPLSTLFYPISTFYIPYYYMKKFLGETMSFSTYLSIVYNMLKYFVNFTGDFKTDLIKIVSIFIYVFVFFYNIYQTFVVSYLLYKIKMKLHEKMNGLTLFINEATNIISSVPESLWKPFYVFRDYLSNNLNIIIDIKLENSISDIYRLWKNDILKDNIKQILRIIYTLDIVQSISLLKNDKNWSLPYYNETETKLWDMRNPILTNNQIANPISLNKNIIVTGPNAGGKTTYVKSLASNIILAQTFGITYSVKSNITIFDNIISFMRIVDVLGSKSYFEAETEYCANMIKKANELLINNKRGLFFMDEPMHSTPPIEGMATAYAVIKYLGCLNNNIRLIITTHFHKLIDLGNKNPDYFINLSVDALKQKDGEFIFPYKIKKGFSKQCIAIELLNKQKFPREIIDSAIEIKNKLCQEFYSNNN